MEKRQYQRNRAFLGGRIIFNHGHSAMDCIVKEISEGGAQVKLENALGVPARFELILNDGRVFECKLCWRKMNAVGIEFVKRSPSLAA